MALFHESSADAWIEAESRVIARLGKESVKLPLDAETVRGFLSDVSAAFALSAPQLLASLFDWLAEYCMARGMQLAEIERVFEPIMLELAPLAPESLAGELLKIHPKLKVSRHPPVMSRLAERYLHLILERDGVAAKELILSAVIEGRPIRSIYHQVLERVLTEIGQRWLENKIDVADEHYCTAITQAVMLSLHAFTRSPAHRKGRVLLACVQTELHELGLRMVGDFLEMDGWETLYYGPNLPLEAICSAIERVEPDLVAISATLPSHLVEMREAVRCIRALPLERPVSILVGGYPFSLDRSLCSVVGADVWAASGVHAVRVVRMLASTGKIAAPKRVEVAAASLQGADLRSFRRGVSPVEEILRLTSELSALHRQLERRNLAVEDLSREKSLFLGMAAHDLRNAIQAILYCARLLNRTSGSFSELQQKLVRLTESSAVSMSGLIDSYLDISRIEAGKLELHPETADLVALVEKRVEMARLFANESNIRIKRSGSDFPVFSDVDSARISQAIDNLLLNAIKFSPKDAEVTVTVTQEGDSSVISVMDQGPGIPPEKVSELFKPYKKLSRVSEPATSGMGLGLHIARRVVEAHGGKIWVSKTTSQGSIFSLALPLSKSIAAQAG